MNDLQSVATIGLLTRRIPDNLERPFGPPTGFYQECCDAAAALGLLVVVFDATDLDEKSKTLTPATWMDARWQECGRLPWPDILYDRAPCSDPVHTPSANHARALFDQSSIPFINPPSLLRLAASKWRAHQRLSTYDICLPETAVLEPGRIADFIDRYQQVYLKPVDGSQGVGVLEITPNYQGGWLIQIGRNRYDAPSRSEVERLVASLIGNPAFRNNLYLVQQGISPEPIRVRKLPRFDLRILMQKDDRRRWALTGVVARVSHKDVPTSNLSTGAWSEEAESTLDHFLGVTRRYRFMEAAERAAFAICNGLELDVCQFGELGIDLIPDEDGQPWIIEVNAKPGRSAFKRLARSEETSEAIRLRFQEIRRQSVTMPFLYAKSLLSTTPKLVLSYEP